MTTDKIFLEICVFNISDVVTAMKGGGDRLELCASYVEGGITPSYGTITETFNYIDQQQVVVMIRPRGGNFMYDEFEFDVMKKDIKICKELGVLNIIFGILTEDGKLDIQRNRQLVELASPMHCTLQRAFDLTPDPFEALNDAVSCGFKRILTSGQQPSAMEGKDLIKQLIEKAAGKIDILPGAGLNSKNAEEFIRYTGCREIHSSAKRYVDENNNSGKGIYDFSHLTEVNFDEVIALKEIITKMTL